MLIEHDFAAEWTLLMKNPSCLTEFGKKIGQKTRENHILVLPVKHITKRKNRQYKKQTFLSPDTQNIASVCEQTGRWVCVCVCDFDLKSFTASENLYWRNSNLSLQCLRSSASPDLDLELMSESVWRLVLGMALFAPGVKKHFGRSVHKWTTLNTGVNQV